ALEQSHRDRVLEVHLADGRNVSADAAVLALGNPPPAPINGSEALRGSPRYIEDPWQSAAAIRAGETVLMIGTGVTMGDTVLAGMQAARGQAVFRAISRHGLIPATQRPFRQLGEEDGTSLVEAASVSLLHLFRATRSLAENLECNNGDWREAVALVRDLA